MKQFDGNIFDGQWDGMVHCANLHHVMGGGIARIIKEQYPEAYAADCATPDGAGKLGTFSVALIERDNRFFEIFNLYGQVGIGNNGHPMERNARYDAVFNGVWRICENLVASKQDQAYTLAFPHGMASALAGGDWRIVSAILESIESHFPNIEFHIYKLK